MSQTTASVSLAELKNLVDANLELFGWEKGSKQHTVLSECILYAETRGNNQGVIKLVGPNAGFQMKKKAEQKEIEIVRNTKISALLNGNQNHGIYVLDQACEIALEKAKQIGIGIVGTFNTSNGTGALNYYASKICKHDMICVILSHGSGLVAPHGSYERKYGTNPICFGVPYGEEEEEEGEKHKEEQFILFDMATSSIAFYQVMQHHLAGEQLPQPNLCYDPAGNLTDNPADVIEKGGAIRTFGLDDFKGNGLSFMVEILAGPLVQAGFMTLNNAKTNWGNLVLVLDPEVLTDKKEFKHNVRMLIEDLKNSKKLPGVSEIYFAGERGNKARAKVLAEGTVQVETNLLQQLRANIKV